MRWVEGSHTLTLPTRVTPEPQPEARRSPLPPAPRPGGVAWAVSCWQRPREPSGQLVTGQSTLAPRAKAPTVLTQTLELSTGSGSYLFIFCIKKKKGEKKKNSTWPCLSYRNDFF